MYIHASLHQRINAYAAIMLLLSVTLGACLMIWNVSEAVGAEAGHWSAITDTIE